ncbi:hypothetical protein [Bacillus cereus]|uniref:hypothetical protein n=1 Tax=Bacillus cereus TaxID=1396 RepID=UPI001C54DF42|nr:hypothetical protein [Bacillus cereus]
MIHSFLPFYHPDWHYVSSEDVNNSIYVTNYYYDALSRQIRTVNAKGYVQRNAF